MKDTFTSRYEISQKAKDAGCNLPHLTMNPETMSHQWTFTPKEERKYEYLFILTNAIIQKWLREEHKLSVEVYFNNGWDYDICDLETNLQNISEPYEYKTFENAFEVALMTALNMIKQDFA